MSKASTGVRCTPFIFQRADSPVILNQLTVFSSVRAPRPLSGNNEKARCPTSLFTPRPRVCDIDKLHFDPRREIRKFTYGNPQRFRKSEPASLACTFARSATG